MSKLPFSTKSRYIRFVWKSVSLYFLLRWKFRKFFVSGYWLLRKRQRKITRIWRKNFIFHSNFFVVKLNGWMSDGKKYETDGKSANIFSFPSSNFHNDKLIFSLWEFCVNFEHRRFTRKTFFIFFIFVFFFLLLYYDFFF